MKDSIIFIGLDVHKDTIDIAIAESNGSKEVRHYGKIDGDLTALDKAVRKLQSKGSELRFVYEAGPWGYDIYRHLAKQKFSCIVVAPSLIPKKSGDDITSEKNRFRAKPQSREERLNHKRIDGVRHEDKQELDLRGSQPKPIAFLNLLSLFFFARLAALRETEVRSCFSTLLRMNRYISRLAPLTRTFAASVLNVEQMRRRGDLEATG